MAPRDSAGQETEAPGGARTTGKLCGEAVLSSSAASVLYLTLAVFFGGLALGMVAMVAVAVRKEDRQFSLSGAVLAQESGWGVFNG